MPNIYVPDFDMTDVASALLIHHSPGSELYDLGVVFNLALQVYAPTAIAFIVAQILTLMVRLENNTYVELSATQTAQFRMMLMPFFAIPEYLEAQVKAHNKARKPGEKELFVDPDWVPELRRSSIGSKQPIDYSLIISLLIHNRINTKALSLFRAYDIHTLCYHLLNVSDDNTRKFCREID